GTGGAGRARRSDRVREHVPHLRCSGGRLGGRVLVLPRCTVARDHLTRCEAARVMAIRERPGAGGVTDDGGASVGVGRAHLTMCRTAQYRLAYARRASLRV